MYTTAERLKSKPKPKAKTEVQRLTIVNGIQTNDLLLSPQKTTIEKIEHYLEVPGRFGMRTLGDDMLVRIGIAVGLQSGHHLIGHLHRRNDLVPIRRKQKYRTFDPLHSDQRLLLGHTVPHHRREGSAQLTLHQKRHRRIIHRNKGQVLSLKRPARTREVLCMPRKNGMACRHANHYVDIRIIKRYCKKK